MEVTFDDIYIVVASTSGRLLLGENEIHVLMKENRPASQVID